MMLLSSVVALTLVVIGVYLWWRLNAWDAPVLVALFGIGAWAAGVALMGTPRPATHEMLASWDDLQVLAYELDEGRAIYLWVQREQPVAYQLPWTMDQARQLHEAAQQAEQEERGLRMKRETPTNSAEGEWVFYPEPVHPLPPKDTGRHKNAGSRDLPFRG